MRLKINDMNTVSLGEDVLSHLGVPLLGRVTEVNARFKQLLDSNFEHNNVLRQKAEILRIFGGRPYGMGRAPRKAPPYSVMTMRTVAR